MDTIFLTPNFPFELGIFLRAIKKSFVFVYLNDFVIVSLFFMLLGYRFSQEKVLC